MSRSRKDTAIASLDALAKVMFKNEDADRATLNLIQMLSLELTRSPDANVSFSKTDTTIILPIYTMGGKYNMLITIALDKID